MMILRILLLPVSCLYALIAVLRRWTAPLWIRKVQVPARVVSVGNLITGGTGKTPFVLAMANEIQRRGKRVLVVSRAYRAQATEPTKVLRPDPREYGDEPSLLAENGLSVWVGREKWKTCLAAVASEKPDVVIVDDGLQHLQLHRDFEIVLNDLSIPWWHHLPLPSGFAREPRWCLSRVDAEVDTKVNLARGFWRRSGKNHLQMKYLMESIRDLESDNDFAINGLRVLLVSAIGNPRSFELLVEESVSATIMNHLKFSDHHAFSDWDIKGIEAHASAADVILMTAKDATKLKGRLSVPAAVLYLKTEIVGLEEVVSEFLA